jgi:hypothetical protein
MRLMKLARDGSADTLLDEALNGRDKTADTLTRLMSFLVQNFGQERSTTVDKYWKEIEPVLEEFGVSDKDRRKIRRPFPKPGDKNFRSILDEMREEGHYV